MFIIIASRGKSKWISGIFQEEKDATNYIHLIPEDLKELQQLLMIEELQYPFYIIEKNGFEFINKDEMIRIFNEIDVIQDENIVYFNLYTIRSDYQPKKPGTDYMGIISHEHITNDFLEWYEREGSHFLIRKGIL